MENRPRISRWIGGGYIGLTVFITALFIAIAALTGLLAFFIIMLALVLVLMGATTCGIYGTSYVVKGGALRSWSPFAVINLKVKEIAKVEQTRIPFYFKGFGASLYSGMFYIPGVGWTKVIITNLTDGVLIADRRGKDYLITPSNPGRFVKSLKALRNG
jgi:hypothetical protein